MKKLFMFVIAAIVLAACGKQHKAESVVRDFLNENLKYEEYSVDFSNLGTTRNITDSVMTVMTTNARRNKSYRSGMKLGDGMRHDTLVYIKGIIVHGEDTLTHTFYLNPDIDCIVAIKEN